MIDVYIVYWCSSSVASRVYASDTNVIIPPHPYAGHMNVIIPPHPSPPNPYSQKVARLHARFSTH